MGSSIVQGIGQSLAANVKNGDGTSIYNSTTGDWTLKNASGVTNFTLFSTGGATFPSNLASYKFGNSTTVGSGILEVISYDGVGYASSIYMRNGANYWRWRMNESPYQLQLYSTAGTLAINVEQSGACTLAPLSTSEIANTVNGSLTIGGYSSTGTSFLPKFSTDKWLLASSGTPEYGITTGTAYGMLIAVDLSTSKTAIFVLSGATHVLLSDPATGFGITEATAGRINVYYSSGWKVKNRVGSDRDCNFLLLDMTKTAILRH